MANVLVLLLFLSSLYVNGINSASFVNNVTVSSDILSDLFFNQFRNNHSLLSDTKDYIDSENLNCVLSLQAIVSQITNLKVLPFFDSWGKFPSGILYGNLYDIGNFDQCVKTSVTLNKLTGEINGQYCFASIPYKKPQTEEMVRIAERRESRDGLLDFLSITIGICVPDTCTPDFLTGVFQSAFGETLNGALSGISVSRCTNAKKPEYRAIDIVGITVFSLVAALMIASSIYDFLMTYFEKPPVPLLLAFSVLTNGKKLFAINTKRSPNTIDCLTGIRVFSMIWVVYGHTYDFTPVIPLINSIDIFSWFRSPWARHVISATVAVDSFFFISGVLVAWLGFRELEKTNGKLNVVMMYVHRYIRLTPLVAAALLFVFSVNKFIGTGPFRQTLLDIDQCNGYNWWPVLIYIQNYFVQDAPCLPYLWYLAIDFQLYILSPLLLIPMWKWGKKFAPVLVVLALLSIGCVMATYFAEGYTDLNGMFNEDEWRKTYTPTHTRYSPWLVGFGLGYFMQINRQRSFRLSKILQLLGWFVSFGIIVSVIFAPYFTVSKGDGMGTVFEAAMYESLMRVSWAIALAWITFACHFGFGGVVDTFLSHPFWQPMGRLCYSLYMVHCLVLLINLGIMRTQIHFSEYGEILMFWGTFGMSLVVAVAVTLAFESPVLVLEKAIFGGARTTKSVGIDAKAPTIVIEAPNKAA